MRFILVALSCGGLLAGCAGAGAGPVAPSAGHQVAAPVPPPINPLYVNPGVPGHCPVLQGGLQLTTPTGIARQGEAVPLYGSMFEAQRLGGTPLPKGCLTDISVEPASAARVGPEPETIFVAPDAPVGQTITVTAGFGSRHRASATIQVVERDASPMTGTWKQVRVGCPRGERPVEEIRELKIRGDGSFSVTFRPSEGPVDYWGRFTFDPATRDLVMTRDGGNFLPDLFDGRGQVRMDGTHQLILDGVYLGDRQERNLEPRLDERGELVLDNGAPIFAYCSYFFVR